ncbi:MAG: hypothetical protein K2W96_04475 [Gemmataceae bacterium]|nr:hypothetical protein [Gemmataceae bacterium]
MPAPPPNPSRLRAARFDGKRQYARSLTEFERWVLAGSIVLAFAAIGYVVAGIRPSPESLAPGPLARPHGAFNSECAACHRPHPLGETETGFFDVGARWRDLSCFGCHGDAPHHPIQGETKAERERGCADCHRDHQGEHGMLAAVKDAACVRCHHGTEGKPIRDWTGHPDFAVLAAPPPRRMKFSHALHLSDAAGKKLKCASCHRTTADGKHYLPVVYESHCKSCHPLREAGTDLPHRRRIDELQPLLRDAIMARMLAERPGSSDLPLVGGRLDPRVRKEVAAKPGPAVEERLASTRKRFMDADGRCGKCHLGDGKGDVVPPRVPDVWLEKARFSHAAHRATDCKECHGGKYAPFDPKNVVEKEPLALPDIATCRQCHRTRVATAAGPRGGVRSDCTTCHGYHHAGDPAQRLGIGDFMRGGR